MFKQDASVTPSGGLGEFDSEWFLCLSVGALQSGDSLKIRNTVHRPLKHRWVLADPLLESMTSGLLLSLDRFVAAEGGESAAMECLLSS